MSRRILAASLLAIIGSLTAANPTQAGSWSWGGYSLPTTRYVIEVEWWHFDRDHRYWEEVQSFTSYEEALQSLMFHEWLLENNYIGALYDNHPHYIAVDVRLREVPLWTLSRMIAW